MYEKSVKKSKSPNQISSRQELELTIGHAGYWGITFNLHIGKIKPPRQTTFGPDEQGHCQKGGTTEKSTGLGFVLHLKEKT